MGGVGYVRLAWRRECPSQAESVLWGHISCALLKTAPTQRRSNATGHAMRLTMRHSASVGKHITTAHTFSHSPPPTHPLSTIRTTSFKEKFWGQAIVEKNWTDGEILSCLYVLPFSLDIIHPGRLGWTLKLAENDNRQFEIEPLRLFIPVGGVSRLFEHGVL